MEFTSPHKCIGVVLVEHLPSTGGGPQTQGDRRSLPTNK